MLVLLRTTDFFIKNHILLCSVIFFSIKPSWPIFNNVWKVMTINISCTDSSHCRHLKYYGPCLQHKSTHVHAHMHQRDIWSVFVKDSAKKHHICLIWYSDTTPSNLYKSSCFLRTLLFYFALSWHNYWEALK